MPSESHQCPVVLIPVVTAVVVVVFVAEVGVVVVIVVEAVVVVVVDVVDVVVVLVQDARTNDVTMRQVNNTRMAPLFMQTSFFILTFRHIIRGKFIFRNNCQYQRKQAKNNE